MCEHTFIKNSAIPCNDIIACLFQGVSAAEYINQAFNGQKGFRDHENCDTCGNENAEKKCSSCKFFTSSYLLTGSVSEPGFQDWDSQNLKLYYPSLWLALFSMKNY